MIKQFSFVLISVMFLFLPASETQAAEFPLKDLIEFSRRKINQNGRGNVELQSEVKIKEEKNLFEQITMNELRVPEPVSDPREVEKAAEFASKVTGVRKDFIMGMLVVESNLGRNPGQCTYKEVEDGALESHRKGRLSVAAWNTFQDRRETIKNLATDLGYDYEKLSVSCNPGSAYAGTGGALGIGQFMPDTWLEYKDRVSEIVKKENPDPWNEKDAVIAMALKLSDVYGVTSHNRFAERNAAKMYLSGTTSWRYDWYANKIFYWSENYDNLIG